MALPESGPISMRDIYAEFGAPVGTKLRELVRGGAYVPDNTGTAKIPTKAPITLRDFYGASKNPPSVPLAQPGTGINLYNPYEITGSPPPFFVGNHDQTSQVIPANETFQITMEFQCQNLVDGPIGPPELAGYAYAQPRVAVALGLWGFSEEGEEIPPNGSIPTSLYNGVIVNYYTTDSGRGYISFSPYGGGRIQSSNVQKRLWEGSSASDYGSLVIPSNTDVARIRVRRGYSGVSVFNSIRYAPVLDVSLFLRAGGGLWGNRWYCQTTSILPCAATGSFSQSAGAAWLRGGYPMVGVAGKNFAGTGGNSDILVTKIDITQ